MCSYISDQANPAFPISDLPVLFPYPRIYPEQYAYMCDLKKTLDAGGHCVLEMPSGTGKTVSLLSLIVAYQQHYPEHRKLIYCSRTMSEIEKALAELKALMEHRAKELGYEEEFRALGLTSRKNLCLHPSVRKEKSGTVVDARCRSLTAGFVKEKKERGEDVDLCVYHEVRPCCLQWIIARADGPRILTYSSPTTLYPQEYSHSTACQDMEKSTSNVPTSPLGAW
jgi:Rad3-related DNA helicase